MTKQIVELNGWKRGSEEMPALGQHIWVTSYLDEMHHGKPRTYLVTDPNFKWFGPDYLWLPILKPEPPVVREMTPKEKILDYFIRIHTTLQEKYPLKDFSRLEDTLEYFNKYYCDTLPVPAFSYLEGEDINDLCIVMSWSRGLQVRFKPFFSSRSRVLLNSVGLSIELDLTKAYGWKCLNDLITLREMK